MCRVDFEPVGRRGECPAKKSLLDCAQLLGVGIRSVCGGQGKCHSCKVKVLNGRITEPTSSELKIFSPGEIEEGWRLACQAYPLNDCKLHLPPESMNTPQRTLIEGLETHIDPEPSVCSYQLEVSPPSLSDLSADGDRVLEGLQNQHRLCCRKIDVDVLRDLSPHLRLWNWRFQASVREDEVVAVAPFLSRPLGLAIDLGTTKVAGYLVDLISGRGLAAKGVMNPQVSYGEDIITRISRVMDSPSEGRRMREIAVECINQLAQGLCTEVNAETREIVDAVIVGNTAMHHLLLHLPVKQLAYSPFVSAVKDPLDIKARDIGLHFAPGAYVHLLPNIAAFVGADHTAVLLATEADKMKGVVFILDIGTNTEVSLIDEGNIMSVSCASGPAFEGGHIRDGMRASAGAIERLRITKDGVQYETIDRAPPVGICGSGVLDALAQLYLVGVLDQGGRMMQNHPRMRSSHDNLEFVLVSEEERNGQSEILITQKDVRELQLAKAAIRTGIQLLLEASHRTEEEIDQVIIAGAFGNYIDVTSAVVTGMLPSLPIDCFSQVGNAAGAGAKLALMSSGKRKEAQRIASRVHYLELATLPLFMETFMQANYLGVYRILQGRRKEL